MGMLGDFELVVSYYMNFVFVIDIRSVGVYRFGNSYNYFFCRFFDCCI